MIIQLLWVALGSAFGGMARYGTSLLLAGKMSRFPLSTLVVNGLGGLFIGILAGLLPLESDKMRLLLITGFCGGFTTFSAFALESHQLMSAGEWFHWTGSIVLNLVIALGAVRIGIAIVRG